MALSITILTGQSGSGKSTAIRALEDSGHYCVDNMPTALVERLVDIVASDPSCSQLALVMDIRERHFLSEAPALVQRLRNSPYAVRLIFLEAQEEIVLRRYSETRRLHPLDRGRGLRAAVEEERSVLAPLRELADEAIDTTGMSPHVLRAKVSVQIAGVKASDALRVGIMSFGFKHGIPMDADMVVDVRFLPNPYFVPSMRERTGLQDDVRDYVLGLAETQTFIEHTLNFLTFLLPQYQQEGKRYFTLAIGCTGGRHRSVAIAEEVRKRLVTHVPIVDCRHRDTNGVAK